MYPLLNFVSEDRILNEKVKHQFGKYKEVNLCISETFSNDIEINLFVIPVELFCSLDNKAFAAPVIAFGESKMLSMAYYAGCVDYLKSPWSIEEMYLRCKKLLNPDLITFSWGSVQFFPNEAVSPHGKEKISYQEYVILKILIRHLGKVVPREVFQYFLWGIPRERSRAIDMHISLLRKKIKNLIKNIEEKNIIKTVRGMGYLMYKPC